MSGVNTKYRPIVYLPMFMSVFILYKTTCAMREEFSRWQRRTRDIILHRTDSNPY